MIRAVRDDHLSLDHAPLLTVPHLLYIHFGGARCFYEVRQRRQGGDGEKRHGSVSLSSGNSRTTSTAVAATTNNHSQVEQDRAFYALHAYVRSPKKELELFLVAIKNGRSPLNY